MYFFLDKLLLPICIVLIWLYCILTMVNTSGVLVKIKKFLMPMLRITIAVFFGIYVFVEASGSPWLQKYYGYSIEPDFSFSNILNIAHKNSRYSWNGNIAVSLKITHYFHIFTKDNF